MRFLKKKPVISVVNNHLIEYGTPMNMNYFWGLGSLAGIFLGLQIMTGIILAMHYVPNIDLAFLSVEHIMRDGTGEGRLGWFMCLMSGLVVLKKYFAVSFLKKISKFLIFWLSIKRNFKKFKVLCTSKGNNKCFFFYFVNFMWLNLFLFFFYFCIKVGFKFSVYGFYFSFIGVNKLIGTATCNFESKFTHFTGEILENVVWNDQQINKLALINLSENNWIFEKMVSNENLFIASLELSDNFGLFFLSGVDEITWVNLGSLWFKSVEFLLLRGSYMYPSHFKLLGGGLEKNKYLHLNVVNIEVVQVRVMEQAIFSVLSFYFEGLWGWLHISKINSLCFSLYFNFQKNDFKKVACGYFFKKKWFIFPKFSFSGFYNHWGKSMNYIYNLMFTWCPVTTCFLSYSFKGFLSNFGLHCLCNMVNNYVLDLRVWGEINKLVEFGFICFSDLFLWKGFSMLNCSSLSFFLFNVYLIELDFFIGSLNKKFYFLVFGGFGSIVLEKKYSVNMLVFFSSCLGFTFIKYSFGGSFCGVNFFGNSYVCFLQKLQVTVLNSVQYVRYLGDFLVGLVGSKSFLYWVKGCMDSYLCGNLHLVVISKIFFNAGDVYFLGYRFYFFNLKTKMMGNFRKTVNLNKKINMQQGFFWAWFNFSSFWYYLQKKFFLSSSLFFFYALLKGYNLTQFKVLVNFLIVFNVFFWFGAVLRLFVLGRSNGGSFYGCFHDFCVCDFMSQVCSFLSDTQFLGFWGSWSVVKDFFKWVVPMCFSRFMLSLSGNLYRVDFLTKWKKFKGLNFLKWSFFSVCLPIYSVKWQFHGYGFYDFFSGRPISNKSFLFLSDFEIIEAYTLVISFLVCCYIFVSNLLDLYKILLVLKSGCLLTLGRKHKKNKGWVFRFFNQSVLLSVGGKVVVSLPDLLKNDFSNSGVGLYNFFTFFNGGVGGFVIGDRCFMSGCCIKKVAGYSIIKNCLKMLMVNKYMCWFVISEGHCSIMFIWLLLFNFSMVYLCLFHFKVLNYGSNGLILIFQFFYLKKMIVGLLSIQVSIFFI